ncbi:MAG: YlbF family regulator [Firmicutes bacterium]|nr:YlbF family regulator [Bacillota bacterium]
MSVYDRAHELARMLRDTEEYREYRRACEAISGEGTARLILRDYRKNQIEVQAAGLAGRKPSESALAELRRLTEIVEMHKPIMDFLKAESRLLTLIADIQKILGDALDLWEHAEETAEK